MQCTATLSSQNQIVIPKMIRQALGIEAGESVVFDLSTSKSISLQKTPNILSLAGCLKPFVKKKALTDKEMDRLFDAYKIKEYAQKEARSR